MVAAPPVASSLLTLPLPLPLVVVVAPKAKGCSSCCCWRISWYVFQDENVSKYMFTCVTECLVPN